MAVSRNFNTVRRHGVIDELGHRVRRVGTGWLHNLTYLIVLRHQLIETLLDHMITIEVLDEHHNMKAERNNDRMDLNIVFEVSLPPPAVSDKRASD